MRDGRAAAFPRLQAGLDALVRWLALLSGLCLIFLMGLTVVDVIGRYVFHAPIFGAQDLSELTLILIVFGAMAFCGRTDGHVSVDLFVAVIGPKRMRVADMLTNLAASFILGILSWRAYENAKLSEMLEAASNLLQIPLAPFHLVVSGGAALYALVALVQAITTALSPALEQDI